MLLALSLGLLVGLPQAALAQILPPLPAPVPVPARAAKAVPSAELYSDIKVRMKLHTVAVPYALSSVRQYGIAATTLSTRVAMLRAMPNRDNRELAIALNNLAWVQEHLGGLKQAEANYKEAISLLSRNPAANAVSLGIIEYNMGDLYMSEHRFLDAMHVFRRAMQRLDDVPNVDKTVTDALQNKYNEVRKLILAPKT